MKFIKIAYTLNPTFSFPPNYRTTRTPSNKESRTSFRFFPPPGMPFFSTGSWNICSWFLPIIINLNNIHFAHRNEIVRLPESWEIILINLLRCTFLAAAKPTRLAVLPFLRFFNSVVETLCYFIKSYENWQLTLHIVYMYTQLFDEF